MKTTKSAKLTLSTVEIGVYNLTTGRRAERHVLRVIVQDPRAFHRLQRAFKRGQLSVDGVK